LDVCNATDSGSLELSAVKFFDSSLQIIGRLEFNKSCDPGVNEVENRSGRHRIDLPSPDFATGFGVNDVKARLTSEVFEVL
jgi:hypothetical protein